MMQVALIVAGGSSRRMGRDKLALPIGGQTVLEKSLLAFDRHPAIDRLVLVCNDRELIERSVAGLSKPVDIAAGGAQRQDSVKNGLTFVAEEDIVLIHDAARPFVTQGCIDRALESAKATGSGVCGVPVFDTLKLVNAENTVIQTVDRKNVWAMQTPQAFRGALIKRAHREAAGLETDDAGLVQAMGEDVHIVMGDKRNLKLTVPQDLPQNDLRIGQGADVHRLGEGEELILCGVKIPHDKGLIGHSDADVATHALMDAILGALGQRDIGSHFPDTAREFKGISSITLLERVMELCRERGYRVQNCDITILAQQPKLAPYIDAMREKLSSVLQTENVNIKASTTEGLGFVGREEGMESLAVVLLAGGAFE